MSSNFCDYKVVSLLNSECQSPCYCVQEKSTGKLYVWETVDYGLLTTSGKSLLMADIKNLLSLDHQHLIKTVNCVDHKVTGTLYLVKEYCNGSVSALIKKCRSTNSYVDESFIWKVIYQLGRAAQAMYTRGTPSVHLDLSASGVHIDQEANAKLDYWLLFREIEAENRNFRGSENSSSRDGSERKSRKCDTYSMGRLMYSLASLSIQPEKPFMLPTQYSDELQSLIHLMLNTDFEKRPTIEAILYHPSLMSHVVTSSLQSLSLPQSNQPSHSNTGACEKCGEHPNRFRRRDAAVKAKEIELREKEKSLMHKEKQILILERAAKEKLSRAENHLNQVRRGTISNDQFQVVDDLDSSSYSADTGETSFLPTTVKLDPTRIVRPPSLALSTSSRRSVRFDTIPEEPTKSGNDHIAWLNLKRRKFKNDKKSYKSGKENKEPNRDNSNSSVISLAHSTKATRDGILETFFR